MYNIKKYSFEQAKKLGVEIKPSTVKNKKIDVFKAGKKLASIGDSRYKDYPTYLQENKTLAEERRKAYKARHKNNTGIAGKLADKILW